MKLALMILSLTACSPSQAPSFDAPVDIPAVSKLLTEAPECPAVNPPPCVVEAVSDVQIGYRLCCPDGVVAIAALAVDSTVGPWGDVTKWAFCGRGYLEEVTHPRRGDTLPWAVLDTYDGNGGPISECRSSGAPQGFSARRPNARFLQ